MSIAPADGPPGRRPPDRRHQWGWYAIGVLTSLCALLATGHPDNPVGWVMAVLSCLVTGVLFGSEYAHRGFNQLFGFPRRIRWTWLRHLWRLGPLALRLVTAVVVGLALVLAAPVAWQWTAVRLQGCPYPVQLRLVTTADGRATAEELTAAYTASEAGRSYGCPTASFFVYTADAETVAAGLISGWTRELQSSLGPRPELWLPGSTRYTVAAKGRLREVSSAVVASTPIVLAAPATARLDRSPLGWLKLLDEADLQGWTVARPEPTVSLAGLLATRSLYAEAPTASVQRSLEQRLARGIDAGRYPLGGEVDLLCHLAGGQGDGTGLIVTEQQFLRFAKGAPLADGCAAGKDRKGVLAKYYPRDTPGMEVPAVRLTWADGSSAVDGAAKGFVAWLATAGGRRALEDAGLRTGGPVGDLPDVDYRAALPDDASLAATATAYAVAKRSGRVLLAVDTSGSMGAAAGASTRYDVAVRGAVQALALRGPGDAFGLWVFPGEGTGRELAPISPAPVTAAQVERRLRSVRVAGGTPLYTTIAAGVAAVGKGGGSANALVVLTDGVDSGGGVTRRHLLDLLPQAGVRVFVVAVGEAHCASSGIGAVTRASGGSCVEVGSSSLDAVLDDVFDLLWRGT